MIVLDSFVQGSPQWHQARIGMPTASGADRLLTPKTRKLSGQADGYRYEILAEWLLGRPLEDGSSIWMQRGTDMEAEARAWYEMERGVDVRQVGFVLRDDGKVGGSPDGLVGGDGGVEIKCLAVQNHVKYLLNEVTEHDGQCQWLMYLTGAAWWDLVAYNPVLPPVLRRIERDPEYIGALEYALTLFVAQLDEAKAKLAPHRMVTP